MSQSLSSPLTLQMLLASSGAGAQQDPMVTAAIPRLQLAQSMMQQGMSDAPTTALGALGRLGQAIVGNLLYNKGTEGIQDILNQRALEAKNFGDYITGGQSNQPGTTPAQSAAAAAKPQQDTFTTQLASSEGGKAGPRAVNAGGFSGQFQFGAERLADPNLGVYKPAPGENLKANEWKGTFNIPGFPQVKTQADFLANPDAQKAVEGLDLLNTDKQIALTPGAGVYNRNGLRAVAHLGGVAGMQKFVESNGQYDPADANGTKLSDYYTKFSGDNGTTLSAPAPGVAPSEPNAFDVMHRAAAVMMDPRAQYNPQAMRAAQLAYDQAKFRVGLGNYIRQANGTYVNAYNNKPESAPTPALNYQPDPDNPGVMTSPGAKPVFAPSPRIVTTPSGDTIAVGPGGVQKEVAPANNAGVAARSSAGAQGTETGKATAALPTQLVKLGTEADNAIGNIDYGLNQLHQAAAGGINSGYFAPWLATAAAAGKSLGVNLQSLGIDPNAVGNVQSAQKTLGVVAGSILQNAIGKDSAITDAKIEHFIHTQPGIETDPHAIDRVLNWARSQFVFNRGMAMDAMNNINPETGMLPLGWQAQFYKKTGAFAPIYDPLSQEMEQPKGSGPAEHAPAMPQAQDHQPPVPGARQAPDGKFYVPDPNRPGKYLQVQ